MSSEVSTRILYVFALCIGVDAAVSLSPLQWPATVHLISEAYQAFTSGTASGAASYLSISTVLLVLLAWSMYLLAGYAAGIKAELDRELGRIPLPDGDQQNALTQSIRALFEDSANQPTDPFALSQYRYTKRLEAGRNAGLSGTLWTALMLLEPRALSGHESMTQGLWACVESSSAKVQTLGRRLHRLGDIAATAGLSGTVLGLIVGGKDLNDPANVGLALQAALLKTFVGFMIKLYCMAQAGSLEDYLEHYLHVLDKAVANGLVIGRPRRTTKKKAAAPPPPADDEDEEE